ncbi:MAG: phosphoheptose isomerase [Acidiferrobacteraceae bacterium]|nr:phosphoheptose isomerase [Acidiferrobacteraceae bacterium]
MTSDTFIADYFAEIYRNVCEIDQSDLHSIIQRLKLVSNNNGKVIIIGNGGSAAIASHVSVDLTKAAGIRAINFNESSLLTCFANDYGYEDWVAMALHFYADAGDAVILISSSGTSPNMVNGARKSQSMNLHTITCTGFKNDNPLRGLGEINLWVNSANYNVVETVHQTWLLAIVDHIAQSSNKE